MTDVQKILDDVFTRRIYQYRDAEVRMQATGNPQTAQAMGACVCALEEAQQELHQMLASAKLRCGDHVYHKPTGETWVVAYVDSDHLAWCGWPEGQAKVSDCVLVKACDDAEHLRMLQQCAASSGKRQRHAQAALALLPAPRVTTEQLDVAQFGRVLHERPAGQESATFAHAAPHPRWSPDDRSGRPPQSVEEWDYRNDPTGPEAGARSERRLNVACDYDDPRAPDQMALVLRIDLLRLIGELVHKRAFFEAHCSKVR